MNINNLSKQKLLEDAVAYANIRLQGWLMCKVYVSGNILYAKLNKDSTPIIGIKVLEKIDIGTYSRHLEFAVVNDRLIPTIPTKALCDSIG